MKKLPSLLLIVCLLFTMIGCGKTSLASSEQMLYDYITSTSEKTGYVQVETAVAFNLTDEFSRDYDTSNVSLGQYVFIEGYTLWDNGAKEPYQYKFYKNLKTGEVLDTNLTKIGGKSDLDKQWGEIEKLQINLELLTYKMIVANSVQLEYSDFEAGKTGYLQFKDEAIEQLNNKLKK